MLIKKKGFFGKHSKTLNIPFSCFFMFEQSHIKSCCTCSSSLASNGLEHGNFPPTPRLHLITIYQSRLKHDCQINYMTPVSHSQACWTAVPKSASLNIQMKVTVLLKKDAMNLTGGEWWFQFSRPFTKRPLNIFSQGRRI